MLKKKTLKQPKLIKIKLLNEYDGDFIDSNKLLDHLEFHQFLKECLKYIEENNLKPRISETQSIINFWNRVKNPRFTKHNLNKTDNWTFRAVMTLITYRMHYNKLALNSIFSGIEKFSQMSTCNGLLMYCKRLKLCEHFLWSSKKYTNKFWFELCIVDDTTAIEGTCGISTNFKNTFEKVKKAYLNNFHYDDESLGRTIIFQNSFAFIKFSEQLVEHHKTKVMCDYRTDFKGLIEDYFRYAKETMNSFRNFTGNRISYILGQKLFLNFVMKTKSEAGREKFFSNIS